MTRPAATIVIPVWNNWELTKACLDSLRPTMGVRDEVVVVDNGSTDDTPRGLRRFPWAKVITNTENRGFAAACNQGAAAASREVIVFLNNDTLVPGGWLDGLLDPFGDAGVGATGPRSNFVSGPQLVPGVTYADGRMGDLRRFAKEWRAAHRGEVTEVARLVGFCLAVRRAAFAALGGFDEGFGIGGYEDDDLCSRLVDAGWRLLIAHESFVHHHGHATFDANDLDWLAIQNENEDRYLAKRAGRLPGSPVVSACMIVRDEAAHLPACLESLAGVADEVVVYDTGSTDATVELARATGARVVEGYWDDDFSRARNAALEHCRGEWVLHVDADELLEGDAAAVRAELSSTPADGLLVTIVNQVGRAEAPRTANHRAVRLFRRARARWAGRLHEQVHPREGQAKLRIEESAALTISHLGYLDETMASRGKVERNVRLAEAGLEVDATERCEALLNLGRSLVVAGRLDDALARLDQAAGDDAPVRVRRAALLSGTRAILHAGRPAEALAWADRLERAGEVPGLVRFLAAAAHHAGGDPRRALELLERGVALKSEDGFTYSDHELPMLRGRVLAACGRLADAAAAYANALSSGGAIDEVAPAVLADADAHGLDVAAVFAAAPDRLMDFLGRLLNQPEERADIAGDRLWQAFPGDPRMVAFASRLAPRLGVLRALEWSARIRGAGNPDACPLLRIAHDAGRSAVERVRAAAAATAAFADTRAEEAVALAAASVPDSALTDSLVEIGELAPTLLPVFVAAAASGPRRALALARRLHELGAHEEAVTLALHGVEGPSPVPAEIGGQLSRWLESVGREAEAALVRDRAGI